MGCCCCKEYPLPQEFGTEVIRSGYSDHVFVTLENGHVQRLQVSGTFFLVPDRVLFFTNCRSSKIIDIPLRTITSCEYSDHFSGRYNYYKPCSCSSSCPNGLVDIKASIEGKYISVSVAVVDAEGFVESINTQQLTSQRTS